MKELNTNSSLIDNKFVDCIAALYKKASDSDVIIQNKTDSLNIRYSNNPVDD